TAMAVPRLSHQSLLILSLFLAERGVGLSGADVMKATGLMSGTVYPILLRFEESGLLVSEWERESASALGRPQRRVYEITGQGVRVARQVLAPLQLAQSKPRFA